MVIHEYRPQANWHETKDNKALVKKGQFGDYCGAGCYNLWFLCQFLHCIGLLGLCPECHYQNCCHNCGGGLVRFCRRIEK